MLEVQVGEKKEKVVMAPGMGQTKSEHDQVSYKSGYATGPADPNPTNETEAEIFAQQKVLANADEYFEEIKKETEEKREEREAAWAEKELSAKEKEEKKEERKRKREEKRAKAEKEKEEGSSAMPVVDPAAYGYAADDNPDNTENYHAPDSQATAGVFGSLVPAAVPAAAGTKKVSFDVTESSGEGGAEAADLVEGELLPPGEEDEVPEEVEVAHSSGATRMVVLQQGDQEGGEQGPQFEGDEVEAEEEQVEQEEDTSDMVDQNVVDMAMAVALEMEEKRIRVEREAKAEELRQKEAEKLQKEAEELAKEAERSDLTLDELTTLRQLEAKLGVGAGQTRGPQLPTVNPHGGQAHQVSSPSPSSSPSSSSHSPSSAPPWTPTGSS